MKTEDFVLYSDTDSLYINISKFLTMKAGTEWLRLSDERKIFYIQKIANIIENYVNDRCYREIQRKAYNSNVTDFRIKFKQEVIAKSAIFLSKKRYSMWNINEEGVPVDKIKNTGLEIVRSETPEAIRPKLKSIVEMVLRGSSKETLVDVSTKYKNELFSVLPEEIAVNVGVSNIDKYQNEKGEPVKGAPWHIKGVLNYRKLLKHLKIEDKYEDIYAGAKTKVVYVKKNPLNIETVSFKRWPKEFDNVVQIDRTLLIEKYYVEKVDSLFEPMGMKGVLSETKKGINEFF